MLSKRYGFIFTLVLAAFATPGLQAQAIIATPAGNGAGGISGDGGPATSAEIAALGMAPDNRGSVLIVAGDRIRKVDPAGIITSVARRRPWGRP